MMRYRVLQHVSFETPGLVAEYLHSRGDLISTTALYNGESLPTVDDFDGLIVMGGPMSVHDEAEYPWLRAEKELIRMAIRKGKKILGICLGAQLIAEVCGAKVYNNPVKEIGFWPVRWVDAPDSFGASGTPDSPHPPDGSIPFFHWHGETFDLPTGAVLLASTDACPNQAFRLGEMIMAVQFHPEVTAAMIALMVEHGAWELVEGPYIQTREQILHGKPSKAGMSFLVNWL